MADRVQEILSWYGSDNAGTKTNIARMLRSGKLAGTGKLVILPVDQGFEHGPARSFAPNAPGYNPHYHFQLAIDAGLSAYAAPLGMIEAGADAFAGAVPTILKVNSANSLARAKEAPSQAVTASVKDALRLGCSAVGFTIYPGSDIAYDMMEEIAEMGREAKSAGLAVVIWSYPRGGSLSKPGETAMECLNRELREELGDVRTGSLEYVGTYTHVAASDTPGPAKAVRVELHRGELIGEPRASAEIKELVWFGPDDDPALIGDRRDYEKWARTSLIVPVTVSLPSVPSSYFSGKVPSAPVGTK